MADFGKLSHRMKPLRLLLKLVSRVIYSVFVKGCEKLNFLKIYLKIILFKEFLLFLRVIIQY